MSGLDLGDTCWGADVLVEALINVLVKVLPEPPRQWSDLSCSFLETQ